MSDLPRGAIGRTVVIVVLTFAVLGFGLAGLCGAVFTFIGVSGLSSPGPENFSGAILVIAVPSLLIGGALAWLCGRALRKMSARVETPRR